MIQNFSTNLTLSQNVSILIQNTLEYIKNQSKNLILSTIKCKIDRELVWDSSIRQIYDRYSSLDIARNSFNITFIGEEGVDAGGLL